mgnify:FL=1
MRKTVRLRPLLLAAMAAAIPSPGAEEEELDRRPKDIAIIFQMGYATDAFPQGDEEFARVLDAA